MIHLPKLYLCAIALLIAGCESEPSRWEPAQNASAGGAAATSEAAIPGSVFNRFFPKQEDGVDVVFKQEKDGFAQADLLRAGERLGTMSISDTVNNVSAREKYQSAASSVAGYPAVVQDNATSILVAERFQVRLQSEGEALPADMRAGWLEKFDLAGLAEAM